MIKRILSYDNIEDRKILTQKSEPVKNILEIQELIQDLKDTVHSIPDAKGLSAIQLGINKRVCFCRWGGDEIILINPIITRSRGNQEFLEVYLFRVLYTIEGTSQQLRRDYIS